MEIRIPRLLIMKLVHILKMSSPISTIDAHQIGPQFNQPTISLETAQGYL